MVTCLEKQHSDSKVTSSSDFPVDSNEHEFCPITISLEVIGKTWTLIILKVIGESDQSIRFNDLKSQLKGISPKTLTKRLRELEKLSIITRHSYNEIPPRVEYELTQSGIELLECFSALDSWANKWIKNEIH